MIVFLLIALLIFLFGFVLIFGAPYLPTLSRSFEDIFSLLDLHAGQSLLELGSGDGRVLRAAAKRGIRGIGYELNPLLVLYSRIRNWRYRKIVTIKWANFWTIPLPETDAVYVFLLQKYMKKLNTKIVQDIKQPVKVVSYAFAFPNRKPSRTKRAMMLYEFQPPSKTRPEEARK